MKPEEKWFTMSEKMVITDMMFTSRMPVVNSRALKLVPVFLLMNPIPTVEMIPTPTILATADASPDKEIPMAPGSGGYKVTISSWKQNEVPGF